MKIFAASLILLSADVIQAKLKEHGVPVRIDVNCNGLDVTDIGKVSKVVVGQVLEESYGALHASYGHGSMLKVSEEGSRWRCGSLCPDDDAAALSTTDGESYWVGRWRCGSLCPDDDAVFEAPSVSGVGIDFAKWQSKFALGLVESRRIDFRTVTDCNISLQPAAANQVVLATSEAENAEGTSIKDKPTDDEDYSEVQIDVECDALDKENLDLISATLIGHLLEESYSKVHDNQSSLQWTLVSDKMTSVEKVWVGRWRCGSLCPDDDAAATAGFALGINRVDSKAWANELVSSLAESGHKDLKYIKVCTIRMESPTHSAVDNFNCGLRGCAEK